MMASTPSAPIAAWPSPPISTGPRNHARRSTRRARNRLVASSAPPSTSTRVIPRAPSAANTSRRSSRPLSSVPTVWTWPPTMGGASRGRAEAPPPENSQVGPVRAPAASWLVGLRRSRRSSTMRTGERSSRPGRRQVSAGSSASAVPLPIMIASWLARRRWPRARACSPVIHWLAPVFVAIRPSSEVASFSVTRGRPVRTRRMKPALIASASAPQSPTATSTPAWRSCSMPRPSTRPPCTSTQPTAGFGQTEPRPRSARRSAMAMKCRSQSRSRSLGGDVGIRALGGLLALALLQARDEALEVLDARKVAIDRGEAHVRDLIELGQPAHGELAQALCLDLRLAADLDLAHDTVDEALDPLLLDAALAGGDHDRALQLVAVERHAAAVALDHDQLAQLDPLEGGEPRAAGIALPAPPHRAAILYRARVLDLIVIRATERTAHRTLVGWCPDMPVVDRAIGHSTLRALRSSLTAGLAH